jgi:hypothetical protein
MVWTACMDESGDLGFDFCKAKTSKKFCITLILTRDERRLEKIVKRTFSDFTQQNIKHPTGVLHAFRETRRTKSTLIRRLKKTESKVFSIRVNKTKLVRRDKNEIYNDLTVLLLEKVFLETMTEKIILIASKKGTNKIQNELFANSVKAAYGNAIEVSVKNPHEAKALQVTDCVSWSLFRYYEHGDDLYYNDLKSILHEYEY